MYARAAVQFSATVLIQAMAVVVLPIIAFANASASETSLVQMSTPWKRQIPSSVVMEIVCPCGPREGLKDPQTSVDCTLENCCCSNEFFIGYM